MASGSSADHAELVAILRGVTPERVVGISNVLYEAGIRMIEVPLNSPDPFASIAALAACNRPDWIIGAGTVLTVDEVQRARAAGARLVVAPNCEPAVIRRAVELGLRAMPGFATATEAFQAIQAGAQDLKLFPASTYGPRHLQALRAVLPKSVRLFAVGGVGPADIAGWLAAGAAGFGLGSELFRPEYDLTEIRQRAQALVQVLREVSR
jgi:2-dehydro-3-deoxyphosphogalactonate aldolase